MALADGLISLWKTDETSGTRVDAHTGGNDFSDNNTVTSATGILGNAAQFTSANAEWLSRVDNASLSLGDVDFMYSLWFLCDDTNTTRPIISKWTDSGNQRAMLLQWVANTGPKFWASSNGSTFPSVAWSSMPTGSAWHFCCFGHDSVANELFIQVDNGTTVTFSHSAGVFDNTADFLVGAYNAAVGAFFNGRIDELAFWKGRVPSLAERTELYNGGAGLAFSAWPTDPYPLLKRPLTTLARM